MNRSDLVNEVAKVLGTRKQAEMAVDCVLGTITAALSKQEKVTLAGSGLSAFQKGRLARAGIRRQGRK